MMDGRSTLAVNGGMSLSLVISRDVVVPLSVYVHTAQKKDDADKSQREGQRHFMTCSLCASRKVSALEMRELLNSICSLSDVMEGEVSHGNDKTMDKDACLACLCCGFMTYSTKHLFNHSEREHQTVIPKFGRRTISESVSARIRLADALFYCSLGNEVQESEIASTGSEEMRTSNFHDLTSGEGDFNFSHESGCIKSDPCVDVEPLGTESASLPTNLSHGVSENANFILEIDVDDNLFQLDSKPLLKDLENKPVLNNFEGYDASTSKDRSVTIKTLEAVGEKIDESVKEPFVETPVQPEMSAPVVSLEMTVEEKVTTRSRPSSSSQPLSLLSSSTSIKQGEIDLDYLEKVQRVNKTSASDIPIILAQPGSHLDPHKNSNVVQGYKRGYTREKPLLCEECSQPFYRWVDLHAHTRAHRREFLKKSKSYGMVTPETGNQNIMYSGISSSKIKLPIQRKESEESFLIRANSSHNSFKSENGGEPKKILCEDTHRNCAFQPVISHATEGFKYICIKCDQSFADIPSYYTHLKTHRLRPYKCKYCNKIFTEDTCFIHHMKRHTEDMIHNSSNTNVEESNSAIIDFVSSDSCVGENVGDITDSVFSESCVEESIGDITDSVFSESCVEESVGDITNSDNIRSAKSTKPFRCGLCGKRFEIRSTYDCHVKWHQGTKPFECNECGKKFFWKSSLYQHTRLHTGRNLFCCHYCGRRFALREGFRRHLRIHTGEKPFHCEHCDKRFNDISAFKRHLRIHSGERPYQCDACGKTFNHSGIFNCHLRSHGGTNSYQCEVCAKTFADKEGVIRHMRVH